MSAAQALKKLICERLTAAAEEIFTVFEQTIIQYEEEIDRQRKLLQVKQEANLPGAELPQCYDCSVELRFEEETNCQEQGEPEGPQSIEKPGLLQFEEDQEKPGAPRIREEQEEPGLPQLRAGLHNPGPRGPQSSMF
ncbi:uncharacterized protein LOC115408397 isoform X3 [Salarias fasciatus]|uniref:uncharacterized protein LOC115408397 isoform X3 n=1 Tax=Salarias fasciatus TaxID=181472 RepID=UPI001176758B|nr:uncharacterized protein LOC115408397 isoform X3 [Salarias fasciatus]